eukprot:6407561-Amphidinium_carterae.1
MQTHLSYPPRMCGPGGVQMCAKPTKHTFTLENLTHEQPNPLLYHSSNASSTFRSELAFLNNASKDLESQWTTMNACTSLHTLPSLCVAAVPFCPFPAILLIR